MGTFLKDNSIAVVSLAVALFTLYLTQLRETDVEVHLGEDIMVYHVDKTDLNLMAPISFMNSASRIGTVFRVAALLSRDDTPSQTHIMNWRDFRMLKNDNWRKFSDASIISVPPNRTITRVVRFNWKGREDLQIRTGAYTLKLAIWNSAARRPASSREYRFVVNEQTSIEIESRRAPGVTVTNIRVGLGVPDSVVMSPEEVNALLGI